MRISDWSSDVCSSDLWDCAGWKAYCGSEGWQTKRGSVSLPGRNAQARNFDLWAAVHHHFQSCGLRALGGGFIDDADLHPDRFGARLYGIIHSRSEEHTSELQSLMRIPYPVICLKKKTTVSNASPR